MKKQGGILSPILFILNMDELFIKLENSQVGCYIGNLFVGAVGYADDNIGSNFNKYKLYAFNC